MPKLGLAKDETGADTLGVDARSFTRFNRSGAFLGVPFLAVPALGRLPDRVLLREGTFVTAGYLRFFATRFRFAGVRRAEALRFVAFLRFAVLRFAVFFAAFFFAVFFFAVFFFAGFFMLSSIEGYCIAEQ
jgi:hypothetical protein